MLPWPRVAVGAPPSAGERESFLAMFAPGSPTGRAKAGGEELLADIDAFVAGAVTSGGEFEHRGFRRRNRWDDDDGMHGEWAVAMNALFARAGKAIPRDVPIDIVVGPSPGWADPWSRAQRAWVLGLGAFHADLRIGDEVRPIARVDVQVLRTVENAPCR